MGGGSWSQLSWNHSSHLPFRRCRGNSLLGKLHQSKKVEHGLKLETANNVYCTWFSTALDNEKRILQIIKPMINKTVMSCTVLSLSGSADVVRLFNFVVVTWYYYAIQWFWKIFTSKSTKAFCTSTLFATLTMIVLYYNCIYSIRLIGENQIKM